MDNLFEIKSKLFSECKKYVSEKIQREKSSLEELQESINEETKSVADEDYDAGRAMLDNEKDKFELQLSESLKMKEFLEQINWNKVYEKIKPGCIVKTGMGNFFIAINIGKILIDGEIYQSISLASPIGKIIADKKQGDIVDFRDNKIEILEVF